MNTMIDMEQHHHDLKNIFLFCDFLFRSQFLSTRKEIVCYKIIFQSIFFSYKNSSHVIGYLLSQTKLELQTTRNEKQLTVRLDSGKNVFYAAIKKKRGQFYFLYFIVH